MRSTRRRNHEQPRAPSNVHLHLPTQERCAAHGTPALVEHDDLAARAPVLHIRVGLGPRHGVVAESPVHGKGSVNYYKLKDGNGFNAYVIAISPGEYSLAFEIAWYPNRGEDNDAARQHSQAVIVGSLDYCGCMNYGWAANAGSLHACEPAHLFELADVLQEVYRLAKDNIARWDSNSGSWGTWERSDAHEPIKLCD
jgi:hypothetical protein